MKKNFIKGFVAGALIFGTVTSLGAVTYNAVTASFPILINGETWQSDNPAVVINGSTYLPLKSLGDKLGTNIFWNADKNQVEIGNTLNSGFIKNTNNDYVGTLYDNNGKVLGTYCGGLKNNKPDGYGYLTFDINKYFEFGATYSGIFEEGIINGYGVLTDFDNTKYEGTFIYDSLTNKLIKNGVFKVTSSNGSFYKEYDLLSQL